MIVEQGILTNQNGDGIDYEVNFLPSHTPKPLVLFLHGFKAFKDWGFYPYLCRRLAEAGAIAMRFSFSLSAVVEPVKMIYDAEKFATNTTTTEIQDMHFLISSIINNPTILGKDTDWNGEIYLCGHSKGGALSILIANDFEQIKKVCTLAAVSKLDRYSARQKELWEKNGYFEFRVTTSRQYLRLNFEYLNDMLKNSEKYSLTKSVNTLNKPLQIIHGKQDVTVSIKEGYELAYSHPDKAKLNFVAIEKAGHGFGAQHPFVSSNDSLEEMIGKIIDFFELKK